MESVTNLNELLNVNFAPNVSLQVSCLLVIMLSRHCVHVRSAADTDLVVAE